MKDQPTEEESWVLDTILSLELVPKDDETGEMLLATAENIQKRGMRIYNWRFDKENELVFLTKLLESLLKKKLIEHKKSTYNLTTKGRPYAISSRGIRTGKRYSDELIRSEKSKAYSKFCEQVFGKDLCQANMVDMLQLEKLLETLSLSEKNRVLDIGCGMGKITEYISDKTNATILGIDIAAEAIKRAQVRTKEKHYRLEYQIHDFNNITLQPASFDTIIAIDSLHYAYDLEKTIKEMKQLLKSKGQMGLFTFQYKTEKDSPNILQAEKTNLAMILKRNHLSFKTWDFTQNERENHYKQLKFARELMKEFEAEGNEDICKGLIEESEIDLQRLEAGQKRRYLYYVTS